MTPATAQRIVDAIAANGGRVGSGDPFIAAAGLVDDDVWDLTSTAKARLDPLPDGHVIGVLLPMRLETRYRPPVVDGDPWRLRVRVHPDPVALGRRAAAAEPARGRAGGRPAGRGPPATSPPTPARRRSARSPRAVGGPRAAFLLRTVPVVPDGAGFVADGAYDPPGDGRSDDHARRCPRCSSCGATRRRARLLGELHPDVATIAAQADARRGHHGRPAARPDPAAVVDLVRRRHGASAWRSRWSCRTARTSTSCMVTGLSERSRRTTCSPPTPGTATSPSSPPMSPTQHASPGGPPPTSGATRRRGSRSPGPTGQRHRQRPGRRPHRHGPPRRRARRGHRRCSTSSPLLVAALWPPLWQRWLKDVEHAASVYELGDWAARVLAPLGPYPALRVGDVPYGVLPVAALDGWRAARRDPPWEEAIVAVAEAVLPVVGRRRRRPVAPPSGRRRRSCSTSSVGCRPAASSARASSSRSRRWRC